MRKEKAKIKTSHIFSDVRRPRGRRTSARGFTLVEMVVALGLFTVVMMISTGALLSLSDTYKKVQSMRIAFDNLNLALESMSREIRMGVNYHCDIDIGTITAPRDCSTPGASSFAFRSQSGDVFAYKLNTTDNSIERSKNGGATWSALTAPEIRVTGLKFYVRGAEAGNGQPMVLMTVGGTASAVVASDFNIQTTVTARIPK